MAKLASTLPQGEGNGLTAIARALIDLGIVSTVSEAFDDLLSSSNERYYAGHYAPTIEDAIAIVRNAGGVPVLAHPWTATRTTLVAEHDTDDHLVDLVADGEQRQHGPDQDAADHGGHQSGHGKGHRRRYLSGKPAFRTL